MLEKIVIENYRCYSLHEIAFKNLSIIVGKNNAGKSTLIETLRLVSLAFNRFRSTAFANPPSWIELPLNVRGISPSLKGIGFNSENLFHRYGDPPSKITAYFSGGNVIKIYVGKDAEIFCTLQDNSGKFVLSKGGAIKLDIVPLNILPQISPIQREEKILNVDYVKRNLFTDLSSLHFRNQITVLQESFPKFVELAENSWKGLRIRELEGQNGFVGDKLNLLVQDNHFVSEIGWMGHGLQMWLQVMWFLARVNKTETVILDEPDVYMHPELQRKLIRLLRKCFKQVILSTHSVEIISEVEPENILIIDNSKEKSIFATKIPVVQDILNSIGSIHNLQLTKLWASKKLLIVEGEDISILKRLQNTIFPFSEETFDTIPNFDIGGWGGWNFARGSSMLLKETVDRSVTVYCLFDSDYHTLQDKNNRKDEAKKIGVEIHIWERKEIENYLVVPSAIIRIIKNKSNKANALKIEDIEKIISETIESMEETVINNLADEIQKQDRKHSISSARKEAKSSIDSLEKRVGGKELISKLSSWSQDNYGVSLSPIILANSLEISEIDDEVKAVIESIEKCESFRI